MLPRPTKFSMVAGNSEGITELNAFDGALLKAGIANVNLVKISSILPPAAEKVENIDFPPGSLVPVAYGSVVSAKPGETIAAAVSIGFSEDTFGVIMEYSGRCTKEEAETRVRKMAEEAFKMRGMPLVKVMSKAVEHTVEKCGAAFAAVALWY